MGHRTRLAAAGLVGLCAMGTIAAPGVAHATTTATTTTMTLSTPSVDYANETVERFTVTVAAGSGAPTGTVQIIAGSYDTVVCTITLTATANTGTCAIPYPAWDFAGQVSIQAHYSGDSDFAASASATQMLTITKDPTTTSLQVPGQKLTYGHESGRVAFDVAPQDSLYPQFAGPDGQVLLTGINTVFGGSPNSYGQGVSWDFASYATLYATSLPAGVTKVQAQYSGDLDYVSSDSPTKAITVLKATTKTTLVLSATKARYGHERGVRLTVRVAPQYAGVPAGKVTVRSGKLTVCVITLAGGHGSCTLSARRLPRGTYHLVAAYAGNGNFIGSAAAAKTLTVTG